ncbi:MAG: hypothetical protein JRI44_05060 [Deltaproteobacteria bacterium]|nr:hypothetical protein [Deltaproteobacteria bacterium]
MFDDFDDLIEAAILEEEDEEYEAKIKAKKEKIDVKNNKIEENKIDRSKEKKAEENYKPAYEDEEFFKRLHRLQRLKACPKCDNILVKGFEVNPKTVFHKILGIIIFSIGFILSIPIVTLPLGLPLMIISNRKFLHIHGFWLCPNCGYKKDRYLTLKEKIKIAFNIKKGEHLISFV